MGSYLLVGLAAAAVAVLSALVARLVATRAPLYEEVADATVDVEPFHGGDDKPKRALARYIAQLVGVRAEATG